MMDDELEFHESTVDSFDWHGDVFTMKLSDVTTSSGRCCADIEVRNVVSVSANGAAVHALTREEEDGELLSIDMTTKELSVVIQWNDFARKRSRIVVYAVNGDKATVTPRPC
jgi:hypothetical protein